MLEPNWDVFGQDAMFHDWRQGESSGNWAERMQKKFSDYFGITIPLYSLAALAEKRSLPFAKVLADKYPRPTSYTGAIHALGFFIGPIGNHINRLLAMPEVRRYMIVCFS